MLNIDDRLIKEIAPKIKPNALSVLLAIAIHLNRQNGKCFPSHSRLMQLTGLGRDAVYAALEVLKNNDLLKAEQAIDSKNKTFGRRTFKVSTRYIKIFIDAEDAEPLPENPDTAQPDTAQPDTANQETQQLNNSEQINNSERINNVGVPPPAHAPENETIKAEKEMPPPSSAPPPPPPKTDVTLTYDQYPNPRSSEELKEALRNYFTANPREWQDGVLEQAKATKWLPEKIQGCITKFCAHQESEGNFRRTYGQYKGMLVKWFLDQPNFDETGNRSQSNTQRKESVLPSALQSKIGR